MWRIAGGEAHRFKQIGSASVTVNFMVTDDGDKNLLTASSDGAVTLWSTDSLLPVYKASICFIGEADESIIVCHQAAGPPGILLHPWNSPALIMFFSQEQTSTLEIRPSLLR